uniref:Uncharacterized protein n=1 Tax=Ditylenchus dipsaci TaxID=166011 RepID=A0A915ESZ3_9BILA
MGLDNQLEPNATVPSLFCSSKWCLFLSLKFKIKMSGYGLSRTKSELILDSRGIDIRPTTGFLTRTRSLANVTEERLWSQRYHPQWPYYLTAYTPTQPHRYVSNIYSSNPLTYYKYARYLNQDNWYDRYSQYPLSYNRNWLDRRYYSRNYMPYRRCFGYPFIGYSSSIYSPYTNYALTGLAY